jgi:hypothetical protein
MSDELPTEERMRRIERGVQRRIDAHRASAQRVRQGVTGGLVVVLLLGGGFALLRSTAGTSTAASGSGSAASAPASAAVPVLCHDGAATTTARADRSTLPASALRACASAAYGTEAAPNSAGGRSASPTVAPRVLCRAEDGALHVYPGAPVACSAHRMTAYRG